MNQHNFKGILVPALTPFKDDGKPHPAAFVRHCQWLLDQGADGLAVFGTTSEANSLSLDERMDLLETLIENGIPPHKLMPGTGCCAPPDTIRLTAHACDRGCGGVLMLPPFYYKGVSDEGLFAAYSQVIDGVGDADLRVYLYHIPPMAQVGISLDLIERLITAYPDTVVGLKDSGGDWSNTAAVLERFPGFTTFAGSESFLLDTLRHGGAGCITASGNVNPAGIRALYERYTDPDADRMQTRITEIRKILQGFPMIPALKQIAAHFYADQAWTGVRPPLTPLTVEQTTALMDKLNGAGFSMADNRASLAA